MRKSSGVEVVKFAVPTSDPASDLPRVAQIIGSFDMTGHLIDGGKVGAAGWILVRTLGFESDSTLMRFDTVKDAVVFDLPWDRVRAGLAHVFGPDVSVGTELEFGEHVIFSDGLFALGGEGRSVLVAPDGDYLFTALAAGIEADLVEATVGGRVLASRLTPAGADFLAQDVSGGMFPAAAALGRVTSLVMWRRGSVSAVELVRKGVTRDGRLWEPEWAEIEPASLHRHNLSGWVEEVTDDLTFGAGDGTELTSAFDLDEHGSMRLRSILRRPRPDFPELLEVLGLPPEAAEVMDGRLELTDLPGARIHRTMPVRKAIAAEMSEARGPRWLERFERGARELSGWYVLAGVLTLAACGALWVFGGQADPWTRPVAAVLIVATLADLAVRWTLLRHRQR